MMPIYALVFLTGDLLLQQLPALPDLQVLSGLLLCCAALCVFLKRFQRFMLIILAFVSGLFLASWQTTSVLSWQLPQDKEGVQQEVVGVIDSLPIKDANRSSFYLRLKPSGALTKLVWERAPELRVGQTWRLLVKLQRIHGVKNPGGFDMEAWALQKGLRASGKVVTSANNHLLDYKWYTYPVASIRQRLQNNLKRILPHTATAPWLEALIIGERTHIQPSDWQVLKNTGTNHLMAIGGLHIGMISGFIYVVFSWSWRRFPRAMLWMPAQHAAAYAALAAALCYSAMSGFLIPAQRASIMLTAFMCALLLRRHVSAWQVWSLALLAVLCLNPLSVLTESFWLSFGTLALIIYGMAGRLHPVGMWWKHFRVQWVIGFGIIPLSLLFFQQTSLISFLANTLAIPWLGLSILPFCLLGGITSFLSTTLAMLFLMIADKSLAGLWFVLTWLAHLDWATWVQPMTSKFTLVTTTIAFLLLLLPRGAGGRCLGIIWLLPLLFILPAQPAAYDVWMTLLDVGQGLSVVVQTQNHTLIYDAGPRLSEQSDAGENIVLPFLRAAHIRKIDRLVISHGDNDHIGGAGALLNALPVDTVFSSTPEKLISAHASYCLSGFTWQWDGVQFEFIYPFASMLNQGNNSSCVLRISNGMHAILLTGDIEQVAERRLLALHADKLPADVLVAPHHGSKTSALEPFIKAVHPQFVLYATGYRNRYHFPHKEVVARYTALGVKQLNTVDTGAIRFELQHDRGEGVRPRFLGV